MTAIEVGMRNGNWFE